MESSHQDILKRLQKQIITDLDVNNGIILPLKTEFVLNDIDVERINAGASYEQRAKILLDILPRYMPTDMHYLTFTHTSRKHTCCSFPFLFQ